MLRVSIRRKTLVPVVLVVVTVVPWTTLSAAPLPENRVAAVESAGFAIFSHLWTLLRGTDRKAGCDIKGGRCKPPLPPGTKEGCNINPDGRCHS